MSVSDGDVVARVRRAFDAARPPDAAGRVTAALAATAAAKKAGESQNTVTSHSDTAEDARARREFAAGGPATASGASHDGKHVMCAVFQPPAAPSGSRPKPALELARDRYGGPVAGGTYAETEGGHEEQTDRASFQAGGAGGIMMDTTHALSRGCTAQIQFLSNLHGFDDLSVGARCVLREAGTRRGRHRRVHGGGGGRGGDAQGPWRDPGGGACASPEVSAFALIHADSFGDRTIELELKKQAQAQPSSPALGTQHTAKPSPLPPPVTGTRPKSRVSLVTLSEAFIFSLNGGGGPPRMEMLAAGEIGGGRDGGRSQGVHCGGRPSSGKEGRSGGPVHVRGKLTSDLDGMRHLLAVEARGTMQSGDSDEGSGGAGGGGGAGGRAWTYHHRLLTNFGQEHTMRSRVVSQPTQPLSSSTMENISFDASASILAAAPARTPFAAAAAAAAATTVAVTSMTSFPVHLRRMRVCDEVTLELSSSGICSGSNTQAGNACRHNDSDGWRVDARLSNDFTRQGKQRAWVRFSRDCVSGGGGGDGGGNWGEGARDQQGNAAASCTAAAIVAAASHGPSSSQSTTGGSSSWSVACGADAEKGAGLGVEWQREWGRGGDRGGAREGGGRGKGGGRVSGGGGGSAGGGPFGWPALDNLSHVAPFIKVRVAMCRGGGGARAFVEFSGPA